MCGEKRAKYNNDWRLWGSPPRVRGKVAFAPILPPPAGITPACAGKSVADLNLNALAEDHPRVCGEKCIPLFGGGSGAGSPPRVRGKVSKRFIPKVRFGITPACAGKSHLRNLYRPA